MDSSLSTRSPKAYGNELPFAMAEATADLKKSMRFTSRLATLVSNLSQESRKTFSTLAVYGSEKQLRRLQAEKSQLHHHGSLCDRRR